MSYDFDGPWVLLRDQKGQEMLSEAEAAGTSSFKKLNPFFHKQIGTSFCGYASSACVLSSLKITENEVREGDLTAKKELESICDPVRTATEGMPLETVAKFVNHLGGAAQFFPMRENNPRLLRDLLKKCVSESVFSQAMVVNFYCEPLQLRLKLGHIAIAAAYHEKSDMILVLDTYMTTHNAWYKIEDMATAMNTFDNDANEYRGFVIVGKIS